MKRVASAENIAKEIKRLQAVQKRQKKLRLTSERAISLDVRRQKIKALQVVKKYIKLIEKTKKKETKQKYYLKYKDVKESIKNIKAQVETIYDILARRDAVDAIYNERIKEKPIQFIKGVDYYLRARNIDITDILLKYDIDSLSDAIYAQTGENVKEEFFGYDKDYIMIEDKTDTILNAIKNVVAKDDADKIDILINSYSSIDTEKSKQLTEEELMEGFEPL